MKSLCLSLTFLCLIGCAQSLKEVRQSPPSLVLSSDLQPDKLANRIVYESTQESLNSRFFPDWDPIKATEIDGVENLLVTVTSRNNILLIPYPPQAVAEMIIRPKESGSVLEYRGISNWKEEEKFLAMVKHCAAPQNSPEK